MCYNSSRGELWLINVWWWAMWGHIFTNHNSSRGELWHKVVGNYVILSLLLASLTKKSQLSLLKKKLLRWPGTYVSLLPSCFIFPSSRKRGVYCSLYSITVRTKLQNDSVSSLWEQTSQRKKSTFKNGGLEVGEKGAGTIRTVNNKTMLFVFFILSTRVSALFYFIRLYTALLFSIH